MNKLKILIDQNAFTSLKKMKKLLIHKHFKQNLHL